MRNSNLMATACLRTAVMLAAVLIPPTAARAIINPQFTPRDLVRGSERIMLLEVRSPEEGVIAAEVKEVLRGESAKEDFDLHVYEYLDSGDLARGFGGRQTVTAVLLLVPETPGHARMGEPDGMLLVGTQWFAMHRENGRKVLREDEQQMFSVWGGSARLLAEATLYAKADPRATFPVRSELIWESDIKLAELSAAPQAALAIDLGEPTGRGVLLASEAGDRFFAVTDEDGPEDVTEQLNLKTASKLAVPADLTGDGRLDLVTWDGEKLNLSERTDAGGFAEPRAIATVEDCVSLSAAVAEDGRAGLVVGTADGPMLLAPGGDGYRLRPIVDTSEDADPAAELGEGGLCVTGDFTGNGFADVMRLHSGGALLYEAAEPGRYEQPVLIEVRMPDSPRSAVCGDFIHDGRLDVMIGGDGGVVLLARDADGDWADLTDVTYELNHHGNQHAPVVSALSAADVNSDGRQGLAMFYADRKPMLFFNRGFGCFGWARELDVDAATHIIAGMGGDELDEPLEGIRSLQRGQSAAVVADLDGSGLDDLFAVTADTHEAWMVFGSHGDDPRLRRVELTLPDAAAGAVTVTVIDANRTEAPGGVHVVRPGMPVSVTRGRAGPVELRWVGPDGRERTEEVVVVGEHRVVLE